MFTGVPLRGVWQVQGGSLEPPLKMSQLIGEAEAFLGRLLNRPGLGLGLRQPEMVKWSLEGRRFLFIYFFVFIPPSPISINVVVSRWLTNFQKQVTV